MPLNQLKHLTICIPTFNRGKELLKNVVLLDSYLRKLKLHNRCIIVISDNGSDDFISIKEGLLEYDFIKLFHHEHNIGFEQNVLFCLKQCNTEWIMLLGDDDYLFMDYISKVFDYIDNSNVGVIIPNFYQVNQNGKAISNPRDVMGPDIIYEKGTLNLMFKAHQLSGLVFKKDDKMFQCYHDNVSNNVYPQLFFIGYSLINNKCVHILETPLKNTVIKKKNFNYGYDNLINEFFININGLPISEKQRDELFLDILKHEFRSRACGVKSCVHPFKMDKNINSYDLCEKEKRQLKITYFKEIIKLPIKILRYFYSHIYVIFKYR